MKLALIGKNVSHSQSENIYKKKHSGVIDYTLINIHNKENLPSLEDLFSKYDGVSITSPYKADYFSNLKTSPDLNELKIVNTIKFSNGCYIGVLTDLLAFRELFSQLYNDQPINIIGDGAMGKMVSIELTRQSIKHKIYSRKKGNLESLPKSTSFIINTCSRDYIFNHRLDSNSLFWDFNYHFEPHEYLEDKCQYIDGMGLLEKQAEYALDFWLSR